jgi:hypothetical protein
MTPAGRSVYLFGIYLMVVGAFIFAAPDTFLAISKLPPAQDPWLRVLGVTVMALGQYYMVGGRRDVATFISATVRVRIFVVFAFIALVVMRLAPPVLLGFAAVDGLGAVWTLLAARKAAGK